MIYIKQIQFFAIFFSIINGYSQGGWDIRYKPIQENIDSLINKEIRIDFRQTPSDTINSNLLFIRKLLRQRDSVKLVVLGKEIIFKEVWKTHRDMGFLSNQYIKSLTCPEMKLSDMTLKEVSHDSVKVCVLLENKKIKIVVAKNKIKGILFKKEKK